MTTAAPEDPGSRARVGHPGVPGTPRTPTKFELDFVPINQSGLRSLVSLVFHIFPRGSLHRAPWVESLGRLVSHPRTPPPTTRRVKVTRVVHTSRVRCFRACATQSLARCASENGTAHMGEIQFIFSSGINVVHLTFLVKMVKIDGKLTILC